MKKQFLLAPGLLALLTLAACAHADAKPGNGGPQAMTGQMGQRGGMNQVDLQKFAGDANAASDKTILTKDAFTAEMTALRQKQMAQFQGTGSGQFARGNGPRFGSGAGMRGQRMGSGSAMNRPNPAAAAATYWKYTDTNGQEVLLALDADGKVLLKYPMTFGRRGGAMNGQPPAGPTGGQ